MRVFDVINASIIRKESINLSSKNTQILMSLFKKIVNLTKINRIYLILY